MKVFQYRPLEGVGDVYVDDRGISDAEYKKNRNVLTFSEKEKIGTKWIELPVYIDYVDEFSGAKLATSDIPSSCDQLLCFREHAKDLLETFVKPYGEFLPLRCEEQKLYVLNVFNVVDCLDLEKSEIRFREELDMSDPEPSIKKHVFDEGKILSNALFRLPYKNVTRVYFTESFINEIEKHQLTGFNYRAVWSSEG
ncbi:hypothetical protein L1286_23925 [Pseudoalteromonas sp. SMS1]|uniref:imm11 family protein n=1 Tax=Pseudoalteromonas sp. SMS1 TaxID=2908894 RepID=UPI001F1B6CA8|nr:DUF1629 domain-containing protein [Pseudoalteromonas sp. SMS1]MCF2860515.1 hypothetical protein [Pseudoalteromonas sp. SMS1]